MRQLELEHLVASATGESLREIRERGFSLADPARVDFDPEPDHRPPLVIDWDAFDRQRGLRL
jgi:hypothetical protein